jgi:hypothetical protein
METIFDAIKTKVGEVEGMEAVYEYPTDTPSGYPYAWVEYKGDQSEILNNTNDRVTYEFVVKVVQEKLTDFQGPADAEEICRTRAYNILEKFRSDNNLGLDNVVRTRPMSTVKEYIQNGTRIQLTITLFVETIEAITF